jgi:hypothetical protein
MSRRPAVRRTNALLAAMALAMVAWTFSAPPEAAAALAPAQTAWWNVANQNSAPPIPPPSDVDTSKHDLYVQGAGGTTGANPAPISPSGNAQGGAQALAAIHYEIPDGAAVQKLTLKVTGNRPPSPPGVVACLVTDPAFRSEDNGPVTDIPKYDCGTQSAGKPDAAGAAVVFSDIGKLVKGSDLLLVLVPGQLDRVVFAHPDAAALQTSAGFSAPPPVVAPAQLPDYSTSVPSADTSSGYAGAPSVNAPAPLLAPVAEPPLPAPLPTSPPAAGTARRTARAPAAAALSRIPLSTQQTRLVVGGATLLAIAAFAAMVLLGPRMNPGTGIAPGAGGAQVRGVGRFAHPRTGSAPRLW